jgi:hypothetical protein
MNDVRFEAWTRRRVGRAAGGLLTLLTLHGFSDDAAGKNRKRRKRKRNRNRRCLALQQPCRTGKQQPHCCADLACDETKTLDGLVHRCCRRLRDACDSVADCCYPAGCGKVSGVLDRRCCAELGAQCSTDGDCCDLALCNPVTLVCEQVS